MATTNNELDGVKHDINKVLLRMTVADKLGVSQYDVEDAGVVYIDTVDGSAYARLVDVPESVLRRFDRQTFRARVEYALDTRYRGKAGELYAYEDNVLVYDMNRTVGKWVYLNDD